MYTGTLSARTVLDTIEGDHNTMRLYAEKLYLALVTSFHADDPRGSIHEIIPTLRSYQLKSLITYLHTTLKNANDHMKRTGQIEPIYLDWSF